MLVDDDSWIQSDEEDNFPKTSPDLLWNDLIVTGQKSGWLKKLSRGIIKKNLLKKWSFRFFALNQQKLFYFKFPENKHPSGVIDFDQVRIILTREENQIVLNPCNNSNLLTLRLYNENELSSWQESLDSVISSSKGLQEGKTLLGKKQKFWKHERISELDFLEAADTGDLLLVRIENLASKITRTFIRAVTDQVAFIIKYVNGKVALFHLSPSGVTEINLWDDFLKNFQNPASTKVFWRKLNVEKSDEMMIQLEEFVQNLRTHEFHSSFNPDPSIEKGKNFEFSSGDLVSAAYKEMGIINKEFSLKKYLAEDFSKHKELVLERGASLDREMLVDFDID